MPGVNIVDWTPIHRTNVRGTIRTVRENKQLKEWTSYKGFSASRSTPYGILPTPRLSLLDLAKDWSQGVKVYDAPIDTSDMRYHVMMPVEELQQFMSRVYRADKRVFDGRYKYFIQTGPTMPVYLAIGRNGRIKVTGNEDLIWFAKRSGLEELPVFISYQNQV